MCYKIIIVSNNIPTNVTNTLSINYNGKKVTYKMNYHIFHTDLLVITLLFLITFICCHYKNRSKQKRFDVQST